MACVQGLKVKKFLVVSIPFPGVDNVLSWREQAMLLGPFFRRAFHTIVVTLYVERAKNRKYEEDISHRLQM
jgi:hypothetical protein